MKETNRMVPLRPLPLVGLLLIRSVSAFSPHDLTNSRRKVFGSGLTANQYDHWRANGAVEQIDLSEENIAQVLQEFVDSDYGNSMFGCHDRCADVGITGEISFVSLDGPFAVVSLQGDFWHRRETVLGRAAMWLNARIPELVEVSIDNPEDLEDYTEVRDEFGEVMRTIDKRSPDFNGDRETMTYQGLDPDDRGPFPSVFGGPMINPM